MIRIREQRNSNRHAKITKFEVLSIKSYREKCHFSLRMMRKVRGDGIPSMAVSKIGLARSCVYDPDIEQIF